jgi:hypothetical protein
MPRSRILVQLNAAPARPLPTAVTVNVSTLADGDRPGLHSAEHLDVDFANGKVDASRSIFDPLWDGPVAQPADPRDWRASGTTAASPRLANAVSALRDAIGGVDLLQTPNGDATSALEYATFHLTYAQRPEGLEHLRPYQERDGSWTVMTRTSLGDLFVDPQLGPLVEAARAVGAAAR